MVKMVEAELMPELKELMTAPQSAANMTPRSDGGSNWLIMWG